MRIVEVNTWSVHLPLKKPYSIAHHTFADVHILFMQVVLENGTYGLGSGTPSIVVCNEHFEPSFNYLSSEMPAILKGEDIREVESLLDQVHRFADVYPAATAAADIALMDAFSRFLGISLVRFWGQKITSLPTSVTLGIQTWEECRDDIDAFRSAGFTHLKIKIGENVDHDIEIVRKIHEYTGEAMHLRVDANRGYTTNELYRFYHATRTLDLICIEQPLRVTDDHLLPAMPAAIRSLCMADESLKSPAHAYRHVEQGTGFAYFNIKLMKSGGTRPGRRIARIAETHGIPLMWGCMDESRISIAAALHAAYACPNTQLLDLDGSFDLASDVANGGWVLKNGNLMVTDEPGLGLSLLQKI
ncbi:MAG: enolase C-terminal domain-like protein [Saprospiraceae bacterium]